MAARIDFAGIKAALLAQAGHLLPRWLPAGKMRGREFVCGSIRGEPGESLSVNMDSGVWKDFASGEGGGDLISLFAAMRSMRNGEAAAEIEKQLGTAPMASRMARPMPAPAKSIAPPSDNALPSFSHREHGAASAYWTYRAANGAILGFISRHDPDGSKKQFLPWTWDGAAWINRAFPAPRPLYGLDLLAARPRHPVVVVEGEKAADAARGLVGADYVVVTWPGGAQAVGKVDFSALKGRKVVLWPDNDEPGRKAMELLADLLGKLNCTVATLTVPSHFDGWDAADAVEEGMTAEEALAMAAGAAPIMNAWPELIPLTPAAPPTINPALLGKVLGDMCQAASDSIEVPAELVIGPVLAVAASVCAPRYHVEMRPGYREPLVIWTASVELSGGRKTATMTTAQAPLIDWENTQAELMAPAIATANAQAAVMKKRIENLTNKAAKVENVSDAMEMASEIVKMQAIVDAAPRSPRLVVQDVTPERVASMLVENGECLLLASDEGGPFEGFAGRYSKAGAAPNLDIWLQSHAAGCVRVDRGSRPPVVLNRPRLSVAVMPQPSLVARLQARPEFRGRGLLGRFIWLLPVSRIGYRTNDTAPIPESVSRAYHQKITELLNQ